MFNRKKIERLKNQLKALTIENDAVANSNKSLLNQRDALVKENKDLRQQITDLRSEYNGTLEAKETERQELCDQLGEAQRELERQKFVIEIKSNTIGRLVKENMWLANTNSNLSDRLGLKHSDKNRVKHPISENQ